MNIRHSNYRRMTRNQRDIQRQNDQTFIIGIVALIVTFATSAAIIAFAS